MSHGNIFAHSDGWVFMLLSFAWLLVRLSISLYVYYFWVFVLFFFCVCVFNMCVNYLFVISSVFIVQKLKILIQIYIFFPSIFRKNVWDNWIHKQLLKVIQRDPMYLYPVSPMEASYKTAVQYHSRILTLAQSKCRTFLSPGGSFMLPFYSHTYFLYALTPSWNPWQPVICCSLFLYFCHFKNVIKIKSHSIRPFGLAFFTQHTSVEIHLSCWMCQ